MNLKDMAYRTGVNLVEICSELERQGKNVLREPRFEKIASELRRMTGNDLVQVVSPEVLGVAETRPDMGIRKSALLKLQDAVQKGTARNEFPVGTIIPDFWTDVDTGDDYWMPLMVVHYGLVKIPTGSVRMAAILFRIRTTPETIRFSDGSEKFVGSELEYYLEHRYTQGCSPGLLKVAKPIILPDYTCTATFFPPSMEEVHIDPRNNPDWEKLTWEYFLDAPTFAYGACEKRVLRNACDYAPGTWWLRSIFEYNTCFIDNIGSLNDSSSALTYSWVVAACAVY